MDREKTINIAGSVVIFFILLFVYSKFGPSLPVSITTQQKGDPFVVFGEGKVSIVPDIAKLTLGVENNGQNLKNVQEQVDVISQNLIKELKSLGISEDKIKTTNYAVYPQYDYDSALREITGYQVSISYEVEIEQFEKINKVLESATSLGVNTIGGINFEINEKTKKEKLQEAREEAVKEAKEKAKGLASASGITLGKIVNVTESQNGEIPVPIYMARDISVTSEEPTVEPNIQPGETEISVKISLAYEVR